MVLNDAYMFSSYSREAFSALSWQDWSGHMQGHLYPGDTEGGFFDFSQVVPLSYVMILYTTGSQFKYMISDQTQILV